MVLTGSSLWRYLLDRGLVTRSSLVDGAFHVQDLSRRNRVLRVHRDPHLGYIVKQVKDWQASSMETVEREASFHFLLRNEPALESLRRFPPRCYAYDTENQILVLELVSELPLESLGAIRLSISFAQAVGESLRQFHQEAQAAADIVRDHQADIPWILSFHLQSDDPEDDVSPANAELRRLVKRDAVCGPALDSLREQWHPQTLIHGDMKWGNCLIAASAEKMLQPRFVDWEFAGWGDPLWDAAGILQEYLADWVSMERLVEDVAPAMRAFWESYRPDSGSLDVSLKRAFGYAAARLIQSAYELQKNEENVVPLAIRFLQVAVNTLSAPDRVAALFFEPA